jgi:hypothetical protein
VPLPDPSLRRRRRGGSQRFLVPAIVAGIFAGLLALILLTGRSRKEVRTPPDAPRRR